MSAELNILPSISESMIESLITDFSFHRSVFCLHAFEDGTIISGGGHELKVWDSLTGFKRKEVRKLPETAGFVRTLAPTSLSDSDALLYIGTTKNNVLEGSLGEKFRSLIQVSQSA